MKNFITIINGHLARLKRDLLLLWRSPIEYVYSFTYPSNKYVKIYPYDPKITKIGEDIIQQIHTYYPHLDVHFIGSAVFKIAGQRDIDLVIDCKPENFNQYLPGLITVLGSPTKIRTDHVEWTTHKDTCSVDVLLLDKNHPISRKTIEICERIGANEKYIRQYEKLKLSSNGVSYREYKRRRIEFFNKINNLS